MGKVNTKQHIGNLLLRKGVVNEEQLQMALKTLSEEPQESNRRLGQILHQDLNLDRHTIMKEIANIYAFDEIFEGIEKLEESVIQRIKKNVESLPKEVTDDLVHQKAIPVKKTNTSLTIAAADPSNPLLSTIIAKLNLMSTTSTTVDTSLLRTRFPRSTSKKMSSWICSKKLILSREISLMLRRMLMRMRLMLKSIKVCLTP